ncbi:MAG TPA: HDOD domain-containing protein [Methylophilaceae bacterium]|nr:HDOD domain-containing protein [Methylophilaceae bacterium]
MADKTEPTGTTLKPGLANSGSQDTQHFTDGPHSTLSVLLRQIHSDSDFPALSATISEINRIVDDDSASTNLLAQSILQDFALTNKLLKLVNTVTYGQFGGKINTISKAVVILGFEAVRNVAMTLILLDFLQNKAQATQLKDDAVASFFAGMVAAQFSSMVNIKNAEEAMICSMFLNLGKLLAGFYFFEESQRVTQLVAQGSTEEKASIEVLGISYNELGIGIAKSWSFPPRLIAGMRKLAGDRVAKPHGELENLSVAVNLANELCHIASHGNVADKPKDLKHLMKRYGDAVDISDPQLQAAMQSGLGELAARARIISLDLAKSALMKHIRLWIGAKSEEPAARKAVPDKLMSDISFGMELLDENTGEPVRPDPETLLTEGIQEITMTLVEEHKLNDVIQMVLETMHRGMGFNHTLFLVLDAKTRQMSARFGFGMDADTILPKFRFALDVINPELAPDAFNDVFQLAMSKGTDLQIENVAAGNIVDKIPNWYKQIASAQSFILLPVMVNNKPVALFYGDMARASSIQVSAQVSSRQLSLLRTLRNQAVLAIKQKN